MNTYNITHNLNNYSGKNKFSIPLGTTRNIRASSNRIYQFCRRYTDLPLYCMFPSIPIPPKPYILKGFYSKLSFNKFK